MKVRTSLSNSDNVVTLQDGRQAVRLDRRRHSVATELDVLKHDRMESCIFELGSNRYQRHAHANVSG